MFAPRPQTHTIPRHYHLHTTAKKNQNQNKENAGSTTAGNGLPSKTPSRAGMGVGKMLAPNTAAPARMGLGGKGGGGKGKGKEVDDIEPKRLFTNNAGGGGMSSSRSFAGLNQSQSLSNRTKTPARAQVLRSPGLRPALAARTPLPSASKPRRSSRRSSSISLTPAVPLEPVQQPTQQQFATPAPKQKHWDEGDSLGSISEGLNELALGPALDEVVEEEEDGEPEYMPPRPEPLPWEPLGAVPSVDEDMRVVMGLPPLWSMAIQPHDVPPMPELEPPSELNPDLCDDDELEEPMFRHLKKAELPLRMTRPPSVPVQTTNRPPIPASRMTRPPAPAPAPRSRVAHGPQAPTPSSRITKPPVPRLGARSTTPASRLTAGKVAPPAPENFDMGLLADDTPIMFDDLEFGFESSDDSDAPHTP